MLFSRNPIGQLCLGGPGYSSRTVIYKITKTVRALIGLEECLHESM